jgi:hypothetical protein
MSSCLVSFGASHLTTPFSCILFFLPVIAALGIAPAGIPWHWFATKVTIAAGNRATGFKLAQRIV